MKEINKEELNDIEKIEKLCSNSGEPVYINNNGKRELVIMDINYFKNIFGPIYESELINKGLKQIDSGQTKDGKTVMKNIKDKYKF